MSQGLHSLFTESCLMLFRQNPTYALTKIWLFRDLISKVNDCRFRTMKKEKTSCMEQSQAKGRMAHRYDIFQRFRRLRFKTSLIHKLNKLLKVQNLLVNKIVQLNSFLSHTYCTNYFLGPSSVQLSSKPFLTIVKLSSNTGKVLDGLFESCAKENANNS